MSKININRRGEAFISFMKKYGYILAATLVVVAIVLTVLLTTDKKAKTEDLVITPDPIIEVNAEPISFCLPLNNCTIVQNFSDKKLQWNSTLELFEYHDALDLTSADSANVLAIADGKITNIYKNYADGTVIEIAHSDGYTSTYSSLSEDTSVQVGATVKKGDIIGTMSTTAGSELASGAHLHLEMTKDGSKVNPADYLNLETK